MIYSSAVYMITEGSHQSRSDGDFNLHFNRWIIAPWIRFFFLSFLSGLKLQSRHDKTACVTLQSRTHLSGSLTVFVVPRGNGKSMELTCPGQCTYRLTEVTVRKDLAQQSKQKNFERSSGTPPTGWRKSASIRHVGCHFFNFLRRYTRGGWKQKKVQETRRSKMEIWRRDQLYPPKPRPPSPAPRLLPLLLLLLHSWPHYWSHCGQRHFMYPERLLHKAVTLIGPRRGGSFCPRMCVGVGLRVRVRVGWAGVGWGQWPNI